MKEDNNKIDMSDEVTDIAEIIDEDDDEAADIIDIADVGDDESADIYDLADEDDDDDDEDAAAYVPRKNSSGRIRRRRRIISNILIVVFFCVFLFCVYKLVSYYIGSLKYRKQQNKVTEAMGGSISSDTLSEDERKLRQNHDVLVFPDEIRHEIVGYVSMYTDEVSNAWKDKYTNLISMNRDCFGYIEVPGTILSLPVMFTPENYQHYIYRNFEDKYEQRGLPFMDVSTQIGKSQNYLVYGHNMNDGTNFGTLREYRKTEYYEEHPYVYFNTPISEGIYQVMFICRSKIYGSEEKVFKYYNYGGPLTEKEFNTYIVEMEKIALYTTGVTAEWGDELLTLSTCDHYTEDGRLVIVCKRIH